MEPEVASTELERLAQLRAMLQDMGVDIALPDALADSPRVLSKIERYVSALQEDFDPRTESDAIKYRIAVFLSSLTSLLSLARGCSPDSLQFCQRATIYKFQQLQRRQLLDRKEHPRRTPTISGQRHSKPRTQTRAPPPI